MRGNGRITARLVGDGDVVGEVAIESESPMAAVIEEPSVQVLLGLWGRPHTGVEVSDGDPEVWQQWRALPGEAFQFGTWD